MSRELVSTFQLLSSLYGLTVASYFGQSFIMTTGKLIFHHNKKDSIESVSDPATIAERTQRCKQLDDAQALVNDLDYPILTPKDMEKCHIWHERISLEEEPLEEQSKPLYFTPCESPSEDTNNQRLLNWYPKLEADDNHYSHASFLTWYLRECFLSHNLSKGNPSLQAHANKSSLFLLWINPCRVLYSHPFSFVEFWFSMLSTVSGSQEESWQVEAAWDTR